MPCPRFVNMRSTTWMLLAALAVACGDGQSTDDAKEACDTLRSSTPGSNCFTDAAYQECVVCHEECGDSCAFVNTASPCAFTCPAN